MQFGTHIGGCIALGMTDSTRWSFANW